MYTYLLRQLRSTYTLTLLPLSVVGPLAGEPDPYPHSMDSLINSLHPETLISAFGFIGVLAILFTETGLLFGMLFPGDSLLFLAGLGASGAASQALDGVQLPLLGLLIGAPIAVITGSQTGYFIGHKYGKKLFDRPNSRIFNQTKVEATQKWLTRYGIGKALFLARFTPFVRTLINPMCGIIGIPPRTFLVCHAVFLIPNKWDDCSLF